MSPRVHRVPESVASGTEIGAFFDVDNTLVPGSAIELRFFGYLWKHKLVGISEILRSLCFLLWCTPPVSLQPLRERKLYLIGKQPEEIESLAGNFVRSKVCTRLSQDGLAAVEAHRRAGHRLVLITGAPDFLIKPIAAFLGIEAVLAARLESDASGYTGRLLPPLPYGDGKRRLVEAFAAQHGLDLKQSYAYGDSPGDVEALRSVGYPLVVNPIRGMARIARRQGWPVAKWN